MTNVPRYGQNTASPAHGTPRSSMFDSEFYSPRTADEERSRRAAAAAGASPYAVQGARARSRSRSPTSRGWYPQGASNYDDSGLQWTGSRQATFTIGSTPSESGTPQATFQVGSSTSSKRNRAKRALEFPSESESSSSGSDESDKRRAESLAGSSAKSIAGKLATFTIGSSPSSTSSRSSTKSKPKATFKVGSSSSSSASSSKAKKQPKATFTVGSSSSSDSD